VGAEVGTVATEGTEDTMLIGPGPLIDAALEGAFHGLPVCHGSPAMTVAATAADRTVIRKSQRIRRAIISAFILIKERVYDP
jgi:hypothetical protein